MTRRPDGLARFAAGFALLTVGTAVSACSSGGAETLPPPITVTIVPGAGAPEQPAAAGPITTTTTAPTTTTSMPGSTFYAVQAGDTLYGIAARLDTTVEVLIKLNPMHDTNRLLVGQELIVPSGATPTTQAGAADGTGDAGTVAGTGPPAKQTGVPDDGADPTDPTGDGGDGGDSDVTGSTLPAATKDG
jgi:LysM repeat protein